MLPLVDKEPITGLITKGRRGKASKSRTLATWATKEIRKLKNASWYVTYDADYLPFLTVFTFTFYMVVRSTLSPIFRFYLWGKPEYLENTTDLMHVTDKLLSHNFFFFWVHLTMSGIQTHNFSGDMQIA